MISTSPDRGTAEPLDVLAYLISAARIQLDEAAEYAPLRLLTGKSAALPELVRSPAPVRAFRQRQSCSQALSASSRLPGRPRQLPPQRRLRARQLRPRPRRLRRRASPRRKDRGSERLPLQPRSMRRMSASAPTAPGCRQAQARPPRVKPYSPPSASPVMGRRVQGR